MDEFFSLIIIIPSTLKFEHESYHKPLISIKNGTFMEKVILIFYAAASMHFKINIQCTLNLVYFCVLLMNRI